MIGHSRQPSKMLLLPFVMLLLAGTATSKPLDVSARISTLLNDNISKTLQEKAESIDTILQLLAEIDLPSICQFVMMEKPDDVTQMDNIIAAAAKEQGFDSLMTANVLTTDNNAILPADFPMKKDDVFPADFPMKMNSIMKPATNPVMNGPRGSKSKFTINSIDSKKAGLSLSAEARRIEGQELPVVDRPEMVGFKLIPPKIYVKESVGENERQVGVVAGQGEAVETMVSGVTFKGMSTPQSQSTEASTMKTDKLTPSTMKINPSTMESINVSPSTMKTVNETKENETTTVQMKTDKLTPSFSSPAPVTTKHVNETSNITETATANVTDDSTTSATESTTESSSRESSTSDAGTYSTSTDYSEIETTTSNEIVEESSGTTLTIASLAARESNMSTPENMTEVSTTNDTSAETISEETDIQALVDASFENMTSIIELNTTNETNNTSSNFTQTEYTMLNQTSEDVTDSVTDASSTNVEDNTSTIISTVSSASTTEPSTEYVTEAESTTPSTTTTTTTLPTTTSPDADVIYVTESSDDFTDTLPEDATTLDYFWTPGKTILMTDSIYDYDDSTHDSHTTSFHVSEDSVDVETDDVTDVATDVANDTTVTTETVPEISTEYSTTLPTDYDYVYNMVDVDGTKQDDAYNKYEQAGTYGGYEIQNNDYNHEAASEYILDSLKPGAQFLPNSYNTDMKDHDVNMLANADSPANTAASQDFMLSAQPGYFNSLADQSSWEVPTKSVKDSAWNAPATEGKQSPWPVADVKQASWDLPETDVKQSSWDLPATDVKQSSWDLPATNVKQSSWDLTTTNAKQSSWDLPSTDVKQSSWDLPATDVKQSSWDLPVHDVKENTIWENKGYINHLAHEEDPKDSPTAGLASAMGVRQKTVWSEPTLPQVYFQSNGYSCPGLFGYFADVTDCQAFFICSWGVPYRFLCPSGTLWSSSLTVCDWANNVRCAKK